jgi:hypothetical protein
MEQSVDASAELSLLVPCGSEISVASRFRDALPSGSRAPDDGLVDPHPTTGGSDDFAITIRDQPQRPVSAVILPDLTAAASSW